MAGAPRPPLTPYEREIVLSELEGAYLIEMRNGVAGLPQADIQDHRAALAEALVALVDRGFVRVGLAPWGRKKPWSM